MSRGSSLHLKHVIANNVWECKSESACFERCVELLRRYRRLKSVGDQMANVCFNMAQWALVRDTMVKLHGEWIAASESVRS